MAIRFPISWRRRSSTAASPVASDPLAASGLFDAAYYLERYPDIRASGMAAIEHFRQFGAAEGRAPNAFFDPAWYRARNPDMADDVLGALGHYLTAGRARLADPGPDFDAAFYLAANADVRAAGLEPLSHFLQWGRREGRPARPPAIGLVPAQRRYEMRQALPPPAGRRVALVAATLEEGRLSPHLERYLASLQEAGLVVLLLAAGAGPDLPIPSVVEGLALVEADADPFALWARALAEDDRLFDAAMLALLTDRLPGPAAGVELGEFFEAIAASDADLIGISAGIEPRWHCHDHFLALSSRGLRVPQIQRLFRAILAGRQAGGDPRRGAVRLGQAMAGAGLVQRVLPEGLDLLSPAGARPVPRGPAQTPAKALAPAAIHEPPRIAFIGPWNYDNGAGVASRGYLSAWARTGFPLNRHPIERPFHTHRLVAPAVPLLDFDGPPDLAVVHLNPDGWPLYLTDGQRAMIDAAPRRAGLWVWETGRLPESWQAGLAAVDAVWTPSTYCRDLFSDTLPTFVVPHPVPLPPPPSRPASAALRESLGLGQAERILLYVFDGASSLLRKNPFALVAAFGATGLAGRGWRLVLKTRKLFDSAEQGRRLVAAAAETPGVLLIEREMAPGQLADLIGLCDIYASVHRSEGFGLTVAEAMAAGRLVIATDHGGSRDFLKADCGFPVPCRLVEAGGDAIYGGGGLWAEIDGPALCDALLAAAAEAEAGATVLGDAARRQVARMFSLDAVAAALQAAVAGSLGVAAGGWR